MVGQLDNERVPQDGPVPNVVCLVQEDSVAFLFEPDLDCEQCTTAGIERPGGIDPHHAAAHRNGIHVNPRADDVRFNSHREYANRWRFLKPCGACPQRFARTARAPTSQAP